MNLKNGREGNRFVSIVFLTGRAREMGGSKTGDRACRADIRRTWTGHRWIPSIVIVGTNAERTGPDGQSLNVRDLVTGCP